MFVVWIMETVDFINPTFVVENPIWFQFLLPKSLTYVRRGTVSNPSGTEPPTQLKLYLLIHLRKIYYIDPAFRGFPITC